MKKIILYTMLLLVLPVLLAAQYTGGYYGGAYSTIIDAPLPVELASFTSNISGCHINLNWVTISEQNNSGFDIERKILTGDFAKVGFVQGKGTVNTTSNYSFEDRNLQSGKYQYRLKQIDNNGNYEYHNLNGMVEIGVPAKFNLSQNYPNPFNPITNINFSLPLDSKVSIILYDMKGREVKTLINNTMTAGYYTEIFNLISLSSGTYFYRLIAKSNSKVYIATKKMILLK